MKSKVISSEADSRTIIVVLDAGEEAFATLKSVRQCRRHFRRIADGDRRI